MKNIILCGLIGTGKTTIAKQYSEKFGYEYIDLYDVINSDYSDNDKINASNVLKNEIDNYLFKRSKDKVIIDCNYLILPDDYANYQFNDNYEIIYLGFNDIDINVLFEKFSKDYEKKNIDFDSEELKSQLLYLNKISKKVYEDCKKYNYKYFDINKDKKNEDKKYSITLRIEKFNLLVTIYIKNISDIQVDNSLLNIISYTDKTMNEISLKAWSLLSKILLSKSK